MSNLIINTSDGIKQINQIQFGVLSSSDIAKLSSIELVNRNLYDENKEPIPFGPLDLRLGVNEKGKSCGTCSKKIADCPGHFGYIRLEVPIFHIGYFKYIIDILRCVCKDCGRVLMKRDEKDKFRSILKRRTLTFIQRKNIFKKVVEACKRVKECESCGAFNGVVKHITGTDATVIVHEKYKPKDNPDALDELKSKYEAAVNFFKDLENSIQNKTTEELTSQKVFQIFQKIPKEDVIFFDMDLKNSKPTDLLVQYIIVPPLSIRPTVQIGLNATNEDDLTIKISEMIHLNKYIKFNIEEGGNTSKLIEDISLLQSTHAYYINSDTKGLNKNILGNKPIRSLSTRLKGKSGRFRNNLSGKRVDFTGRTVISPDPNLKIDQVGIPILMAKIMTYPERVTQTNIAQMRKFVLNGPDQHPGANFVESNGNKIYLGFTSRKKTAEELKVGDIVERHLMDNDIVLFNRQPSLHRLSIMAFRAKILPWRTLRFNESVCTPFNADFDGDEMNIHLPQTDEARSEAIHIMGVVQNLSTPKNAEPLVASTQDFLTTFFLITQKDYFLDRAHFFKYIAYFGDANEKIDIPPPCILKPVELWTGKQLFSVLLRPNRFSKVFINVEFKARNFSKLYKKDEFRCPNDGYVVIRNSELLCGNIDKVGIGNSSKNGLIFALIKDNNKYVTAQILNRISKFSARWIGDYGMSFGIGDVIPREDLIENKNKLVEESYEESEKLINSFEKGAIQLKPGMNAEQSLESALNKILSDVRESVGGYLRTTLPKSNSALIMAVCGSKGSDINLSQMIGCLGQQIVSGQRIGNGFYNRTLPHFEENSKYPAAKGFVRNSFYNGLNATEFFFHTVGGREGLVDTAVKTAETGYMQRRLMKALEDLTVQYNNVVTISSGEILQFVYGDDGIDPMSIDSDNRVVNLPRLLNLIKSFYPRKINEPVINENELLEIVKNEISMCPIRQINDEFLKEISSFFESIVTNITKAKVDMNYDDNNSSHTIHFINSMYGVTSIQIIEFFRILWLKYQKAQIVPGEAVGAVAAQSIGEPGTQMTLKTFHFAGVASMNITLGVPRIKEIINHTKNISTPVIFAKLLQENDLIAARIVKGRIEKTKLCEIVEYIKEIISPKGCYIKIKLDVKAIDNLKLDVSIDDIKNAILLNKKKLKLRENNIIKESSIKLKIEPYDTSRDNMYFAMQQIKKNIGEINVTGIKTITRAVINKRDKKAGETDESYILAIEGTGLLEIMNTPGIDFKHCMSNNIDEINTVLGIEAARSTIVNEIKFTMGGHGIQVDTRHLQLVADLMTFKGNVYGFQRFGMAKMKESVLMHSSFERTTDILFDASFHSKADQVKGVSECIITGKMMPVGTGIFKAFYDPTKHNMNLNPHSRYREKANIIEEKLKMASSVKNKVDISNLLSFNLVDNIR